MNQPGKKPKTPTRSDFLNNPRSFEVREVCVQICDRARRLMRDPDVPEDLNERQRLYTDLRELHAQLIGLNIVQNLHVGSPKKEFEDPVKMAEFVAGQLLTTAIAILPSENEALTDAAEWSTGKLAEAYAVDAVPNRFADYALHITKINMAISNLDANEDLGIKKDNSNEA